MSLEKITELLANSLDRTKKFAKKNIDSKIFVPVLIGAPLYYFGIKDSLYADYLSLSKTSNINVDMLVYALKGVSEIIAGAYFLFTQTSLIHTKTNGAIDYISNNGLEAELSTGL